MKSVLILISYLLIFPAHVFASSGIKKASRASASTEASTSLNLELHTKRIDDILSSRKVSLHTIEGKKITARDYVYGDFKEIDLKFNDGYIGRKIYLKMKKSSLSNGIMKIALGAFDVTGQNKKVLTATRVTIDFNDDPTVAIAGINSSLKAFSKKLNNKFGLKKKETSGLFNFLISPAHADPVGLKTLSLVTLGVVLVAAITALKLIGVAISSMIGTAKFGAKLIIVAFIAAVAAIMGSVLFWSSKTLGPRLRF